MKKSTCSLPLLPLCIFWFLFLPSLVRSAPSFKSVAILLNCGASSNAVDADKRQWLNDSNTLFRPPNSQSSFPSKASKVDFSILYSVVPYDSARVFTSHSYYKFTGLSEGRHFVRFHFLPAFYNDRDAKNAFFSVTTGPYTLLSNFSAAITASNLSLAYIMREFFITVPSSGSLTLTFMPSPTTPDSFAFINGIEVVSSPELFPFGAFNPASAVSSDQIFRIQPSEALQTVVRLNVGGSFIPPTGDSGLSRTWYDDTPYVYGAALGVSYPRDSNVSIQYSKVVPDYIAPPDVYGTARSMGPNASVNMNYNLDWSIAVDNGFRYLVRLHFCEIQSEINKPNQRVFDIYVNNMTVELKFDVINYASIKVHASNLTGVPVYRDYVIEVPEQGRLRSELSIKLHPDVDINPFYMDAILNGIEVFKVNATSGNLAGRNPDQSLMLAHDTNPTHRKGIGRYLTIAGTAGGVPAVLVIGACFYCLLRKRRRQEEKGSDGGDSTSTPLSLYAQATNTNWKATTSSGNKSEHGLNTASNASCRHFTFSEVVAATNNFDDELLLGVGGFGKVYRGEVDGGTKVAIKRGNQLSQQGVREFRNEIEMLSKLRHRHLVSLIGYCDDNSEMILVYNYMAHGTLRQHLYGTNHMPLSWRQRLEICIGAAKGLHYLHTGATYTLIHRDVKTTNILLDEKWVAKVSDFGLSRMGTSMDCSHVSTGVKGTFGYFDPEYFRLHRLTEKSDVYSFGVVMLELLCARPVIDVSRPMEEISLAGWALHCMKEGRTEQVIDRFLKGKIIPECLLRFVETAETCLAETGAERPSMANVVSSLEYALGLQINAEEGRSADGSFVNLGGVEEEASISSMAWETDDDRSGSAFGGQQAATDSRNVELSAVCVHSSRDHEGGIKLNTAERERLISSQVELDHSVAQ